MITIVARLLAAAGLVCLVLGVTRTRRLGPSLAFTLELWTAAGLLRLTADQTPSAIATAAMLVALRKLVGFGIAASGSGPAPPREKRRDLARADS